LNRGELKKNIVDPFIKSEQFLVGGCPIDAYDVIEISINETGKKSSDLIDHAYKEELIDSEFDEEDYVFDQGNNVTRKFITQLPRKIGDTKQRRELEPRNIFVVHGRDYKPVEELKVMLKEFGLNPIVLHEQPSGSRTIVEKLEKYSDVGYAFVVLTPDDEGISSNDFDKEILKKGPIGRKATNAIDSMLSKMRVRARQNVVLEFGYFIGKLERDRICCLHKGNVELPSDMHGIVYIHFKESVNEVRGKIVKELKAAGYETLEQTLEGKKPTVKVYKKKVSQKQE
jgi:predicted nucleotide-binding protein